MMIGRMLAWALLFGAGVVYGMILAALTLDWYVRRKPGPLWWQRAWRRSRKERT